MAKIRKQDPKFYTDNNGQISFVANNQNIPKVKKLYRYCGNVWGARDEKYPVQEIYTYANSIQQAKNQIEWRLGKKLYIKRKDILIDSSKLKEVKSSKK